MVELMKSRAAELVHNFRLEDHPVTTFFTHKDHPMSGKYFLDSSDKISFFYEKDALDSNGTLQVPKTLAFNKIGHGNKGHKDLINRVAFAG